MLRVKIMILILIFAHTLPVVLSSFADGKLVVGEYYNYLLFNSSSYRSFRFPRGLNFNSIVTSPELGDELLFSVFHVDCPYGTNCDFSTKRQYFMRSKSSDMHTLSLATLPYYEGTLYPSSTFEPAFYKNATYFLSYNTIPYKSLSIVDNTPSLPQFRPYSPHLRNFLSPRFNPRHRYINQFPHYIAFSELLKVSIDGEVLDHYPPDAGKCQFSYQSGVIVGNSAFLLNSTTYMQVVDLDSMTLRSTYRLDLTIPDPLALEISADGSMIYVAGRLSPQKVDSLSSVSSSPPWAIAALNLTGALTSLYIAHEIPNSMLVVKISASKDNVFVIFNNSSFLNQQDKADGVVLQFDNQLFGLTAPQVRVPMGQYVADTIDENNGYLYLATMAGEIIRFSLAPLSYSGTMTVYMLGPNNPLSPPYFESIALYGSNTLFVGSWWWACLIEVDLSAFCTDGDASCSPSSSTGVHDVEYINFLTIIGLCVFCSLVLFGLACGSWRLYVRSNQIAKKPLSSFTDTSPSTLPNSKTETDPNIPLLYARF